LLVTDIGPVFTLSPGYWRMTMMANHDEALSNAAQGMSVELYKSLYLALLFRPE
jgi:hypothetical protein